MCGEPLNCAYRPQFLRVSHVVLVCMRLSPHLNHVGHIVLRGCMLIYAVKEGARVSCVFIIFTPRPITASKHQDAGVQQGGPSRVMPGGAILMRHYHCSPQKIRFFFVFLLRGMPHRPEGKLLPQAFCGKKNKVASHVFFAPFLYHFF